MRGGTESDVLIIARILQGMGGGGLQPIAQSVLLESFAPAKRGAAMALYGMGIVVAPIIGPTLGGWITDNYSWRWIFYINLPIGMLAAFMANAFVEDPPYLQNQKPGRIDYTGFGLMALGLGSLELTLDLGQQRDWFESSLIVFTATLSAVCILGFIVWELYTPEPIVNLRVFLNRNFAVGCAMIASVGVVLYGSTALLPLFLQTLLGYPAVESGFAVSPRGVGSIVSMMIVGRLIGRRRCAIFDRVRIYGAVHVDLYVHRHQSVYRAEQHHLPDDHQRFRDGFCVRAADDPLDGDLAGGADRQRQRYL